MKNRKFICALAISLSTVGLLSCEDSSSCPAGMHLVDDGNGSTFCVPDNYPPRN